MTPRRARRGAQSVAVDGGVAASANTLSREPALRAMAKCPTLPDGSRAATRPTQAPTESSAGADSTRSSALTVSGRVLAPLAGSSVMGIAKPFRGR